MALSRLMTKPSVAIVEDHDSLRHLLVTALTSSGFQVTEYDCGASFLEAIARERPSAVLLDFRLGDMDALDVMEHLVEQGIVVPVVLHTSAPDEPRVNCAMATGRVSALLPKPTSFDDIVLALQRAISNGG